MLRVHDIDMLQMPTPYFAPFMEHEVRSQDPFQPTFPSGSSLRGRVARNVAVRPANSTSDLLPSGPIGFGATGDQMLAIQQALFALGYFGPQAPEESDERNVFGDKTMASLAA
jgi:hypothetical protein